MEEQEDEELSKIINQRLSKSYKAISQEDLLKSLNIKPSELN
jgi:hypothetical protein